MSITVGLINMAHSIAAIATWLERIVEHEGVLSLRPDDPGNWTGGAINHGVVKGTKYGISAGAYPDLDIVNLTKEEAAAIYKQDYLDRLNSDKFSAGVAYQLLDFAVNSGVVRAKKALQAVLGVKQDGYIGAITLAAMDKKTESDIVMLVVAYRLDFMADLYNFHSAGRGWVHRMAKNLRYAAADTD